MAYANLEGLGWLAEDMQSWTAAQIAAAGAHYEPKLRFNSTPVYSVTLAEDVSCSQENPYIIPVQLLGANYKILLFQVIIPAISAGTAGSVILHLFSGESECLSFLAGTSGAAGFTSLTTVDITKGYIDCTYSSSTTITNTNNVIRTQQVIPIDDVLDRIEVWKPGAAFVLPTGWSLKIFSIAEV